MSFLFFLLTSFKLSELPLTLSTKAPTSRPRTVNNLIKGDAIARKALPMVLKIGKDFITINPMPPIKPTNNVVKRPPFFCF